ncbi:hypothetical protein T440DRAFT_413170 [Plenodomus tracheiphilus IPT5]|uniref:Box C/D snoRNA protein 1 n=1 Tax=Plenodomus tracheiphilus IPT5 TaxID=1408161 RepID=A0A6A7BPN1_9PLEO|nr:hypothetical protein T440DRAFT_413170 [Plenodomus tracheiphilus IPT5]
MSEDTLLSDLCSICNINKSKYCCPGCAARTCSLPCYKRHQQWAQCSGKRDPTKFVKKSQLVTPAGIDHDFNFLSGIERNLEKAERAVSATTDAPPDGSAKLHHGKINYHRLEAADVRVIRAPQGLSRQRENKSHISKTKKANRNIVWTVEWLDEENKRLLTETSSTAYIKDANPFCRRSNQHKSKKRKLASDALQSADIVTEEAYACSPKQPEDKSKDEDEVTEQLPSETRQSPVIQDQDTKSSTAETISSSDNNILNEIEEQYRFYLLKPRTSSTRKVLIPLDPSQPLSENLRGHTVLEFPTIYVFPISTCQQLPADYMLEADYIKQEGEEQKELDELLQGLDPETLKRLKQDGPTRDNTTEEEVDSKKILDVLKQDLGGAL